MIALCELNEKSDFSVAVNISDDTAGEQYLRDEEEKQGSKKQRPGLFDGLEGCSRIDHAKVEFGIDPASTRPPASTLPKAEAQQGLTRCCMEAVDSAVRRD